MKARILSIAMGILLLMGCSRPSTSITGSASHTVTFEDTVSWYLHPLAYALGSHSWETAEQAEADSLVAFYFLKGQESMAPTQVVIGAGIGAEAVANRQDVENYLQQYFEVPEEYIRTSRYYLPEHQLYYMVGMGTTVEIQLRDTDVRGSILSVDYQGVIDDGVSFHSSWTGTLTLEAQENGRYWYRSHKKGDTMSEGILNDGYGKYARPFCGELSAYSWENAQQADPDGLVSYFSYHQLFLQGDEAGTLEDTTSAEELEAVVCRYFQVDPEQIRTSGYYNEETGSYDTSQWRFEGEITVVKAIAGDTETMLWVQWADPLEKEEPWSGTVRLRIADENHQYLSFARTDRQD